MNELRSKSEQAASAASLVGRTCAVLHRYGVFFQGYTAVKVHLFGENIDLIVQQLIEDGSLIEGLPDSVLAQKALPSVKLHRRFLGNTASALALACLCLPGWAQTLWHSTSHGMSLAQVRKLFPAATYEPQPYSLGTRELLRLTNYVIANEPFTVTFFFRGNRLSEVSLILSRHVTFSGAEPIFDRLLLRLRKTYGRETRSAVTDDLPFKARTARWRSGKTKISLDLGGTEEAAILSMNYRLPPARATWP